jgi:hypothetical protein
VPTFISDATTIGINNFLLLGTNHLDAPIIVKQRLLVVSCESMILEPLLRLEVLVIAFAILNTAIEPPNGHGGSTGEGYRRISSKSIQLEHQ